MKTIKFDTPQSLPQKAVNELRLAHAQLNFESGSGLVYLTNPADRNQVRVPLSAKTLAAIEDLLAADVAQHKDVPSGGKIETVPVPVPVPVPVVAPATKHESPSPQTPTPPSPILKPSVEPKPSADG